jgi:hypothetical protein
MADLSITAASVIPGTGAQTRDTTAGATITAGKVVTVDPATSKYVLCDTDHATAALRIAKGIALNGASDGQPLKVQTEGPITLGAVLTAGVAYYASNTAGGICPAADVATERSVLLGIASSSSVLELDIQDSGVTVA